MRQLFQFNTLVRVVPAVTHRRPATKRPHAGVTAVEAGISTPDPTAAIIRPRPGCPNTQISVSNSALMTIPPPKSARFGLPASYRTAKITIHGAEASDAEHSRMRENRLTDQLSRSRVTTVINISTAAPVRDSGRMTISY